ncbi:MAG TPA: helical backbone metal receptor [Cytophagaceae bacterium]|nr:helical backbone metal receptor [Cytophagaceae bacterium]
MRNFKDQMGNEVVLPATPLRIVSLVPSQTELLFDLGLENNMVGITRYCIHPKSKVGSAIEIGGTKKIDLKKIIELKPDLIIGNKEENYKEGIEGLQKKFPVWMSDIKDIYDALFMIQSIGELTGKEEDAYQLAYKIKKDLTGYHAPYRLTASYFIWKNPYMTIGDDTFIHEMLSIAGFSNIFMDKKRYPVVSEEEIKERSPDVIFLSSEPYPFVEKHLEEFRQLCPDTLVILVDGEMFSWYGSRLRHSVPYFKVLEKNITQWLARRK